MIFSLFLIFLNPDIRYLPLTPYILAMTDSSEQKRANQLHRVGTEPVSSDLVLRHSTDFLDQLEPLGISTIFGHFKSQFPSLNIHRQSAVPKR